MEQSKFADTAAPSPYSHLTDEYTAANNAEAYLYATPDIVSPGELETIVKRFDSDSGNKTSAEKTEIAALLSTSAGCREWIRRQLLEREPKFTNPKTLRIFASTWNVNGKKPAVPLDPWLWDDKTSKSPPDIFIIGLQEAQSLSGLSVMTTDDTRGTAWREKIEARLQMDADYVTIGAKQMVGVYLMVLVKKEHAGYVQNVAISEAGTGFMRTGGNKGGVSCRFIIYDKALCAVSSHLAAHDYNVDRRNQDFHDVVRKCTFSVYNPEVSPFDYREPPALESNGLEKLSSVVEDEPDLFRAESRYNSVVSENSVPVNLLDHDVVFWVGDLNYRLDELEGEKVCELISEKNYKQLIAHDQLIKSIKGGEAFQGFEELPLNFDPTYKYNTFNNEYARDEEEEQALKRTPAWTDRILWRDRIRSLPRDFTSSSASSSPSAENKDANGSGNGNGNGKAANGSESSLGEKVRGGGDGLRVSDYRRHEIFSSDHRPVSAVFDIDVNTVDVEKRNEIVDGIHRSLRKLQNLVRPRISLSTTVIDLGLVEFSKPTTAPTPLVIRNLGHVPVQVKIGDDEFPEWLQVEDNQQRTIAPSSEAVIHFKALVDADTEAKSKLNMGEEKLLAGVPLLIQGKPEAFISITGQYQPTSFGNSIPKLAMHPKPFYIDMNNPANSPAFSVKSLVVPKEIHILVSYLVKGWDQKKKIDTCELHTNEELFLHSDMDDAATREKINNVRRIIDEGKPIPDGTSVSAVTSCLLALLNSLEEPVIPYSCYDAILALSKSEAPFKLDDVQLELERRNVPAPVFNTLVYLSAMLNELNVTKACMVRVKKNGVAQFELKNENINANLTKVLTAFTNATLKKPKKDYGLDPNITKNIVDAEEKDRLQFSVKMIQLCANNLLPATFDYTVHGSNTETNAVKENQEAPKEV